MPVVLNRSWFVIVAVWGVSLTCSGISQAEITSAFTEYQISTRASAGASGERIETSTFDEFTDVTTLTEQRESSITDPDGNSSASAQTVVTCFYTVSDDGISASGSIEAAATAIDSVGVNDQDLVVSGQGSNGLFFEASFEISDAPALLVLSASVLPFLSQTSGGAQARFEIRVSGPNTNVSLLRDCSTFGGTSCAASSFDEELVLQPGFYRVLVDTILNTRDGGGTFSNPESCNASLTANWSWSVTPDDCELVWKVEDGALEEATSWNPERVPSDTGLGCDNLLLSREGVYAVSMGTVAANSLRVTQGLPLLTGTQLTLGAVVGTDGLRIGDSGLLNLLGGTVSLPFGGAVALGTTGVGAGEPSRLVVSGAETSLNQAASGTANIGGVQAGLLEVVNGGEASGGALSVGVGASGTVSVQGGSGGTRSTAAYSGDVSVGAGSDGNLVVTEGGFFGAFGTTFVGLSSPGSVSVHTEDGNGNAAELDLKDLVIGGDQSGTALVSVGVGGSVTAEDVFVGNGVGDGSLFLDGRSGEKGGGFAASFAASGNVDVGFGNTGQVEVKGAAHLVAGTPGQGHVFRVAGDAGGSGTVTVEGFVQETPHLEIQGDLDLGPAGPGVLTVSSGNATATGALLVDEGRLEISSKAEDTARSALIVDGSSTIAGPDDGVDTVTTILGGAVLEVKQSLAFANGRMTVSGSLSDFAVDPNLPLVDSAALLKVLDVLTVGTLEPTIVGDARLRLLSGGNADVGELRILSGEVAVLSPLGVARPSALQSFVAISVGNSPEESTRTGTLRILGESFVDAPAGIVVKGTGRLIFSKGAAIPKPTVEPGGKVERLRGLGFKKGASAPATMDGGLELKDGALLVINADSGTEPNILINGDATLLGDLEVTFSEEKALQAGATFTLFEVTGVTSGDFGEVRFPTRSDEFEGDLAFENGQFKLTVVNPGTAVVPPNAADINDDGNVDAVDVQLVINAVLGLSLDAAFEPDVNSDVSVDAVDIQLVINAALGLAQ